MKINDIEIKHTMFAYDDCHKIYLIDDFQKKEALDKDYNIYDIKDIANVYMSSCELRFINIWESFKTIIPQFSEVVDFDGFHYDKKLVNTLLYYDVEIISDTHIILKRRS
jgi:hypothetical protein